MATSAIVPGAGDVGIEPLKAPRPSDPGYKEWRMTGKMPDSISSGDGDEGRSSELTPSEGAEHEAAHGTETSGDGHRSSEAAAASEAAKPQEAKTTQRKRSDASDGINRLLDENRQLRRELEEAKKPRQPERVAEAAKPAERPRPDPEAIDPATGKRKYADWKAYEDDLLEWNTERVLAKVDARSAEAQKSADARRSAQQIATEFESAIGEARKVHADFDAVAINNEALAKEIPRGSIVDLAILQTGPLGARLLYHFGKNPGKVAEILKLKPFEQSAELVKLQTALRYGVTPQQVEQALEAAFKKPGAAGARPPARPISKAPAPPTELGTHGVPGDESERAVKTGDFTSFREAENAKALARMGKGKG